MDDIDLTQIDNRHQGLPLTYDNPREQAVADGILIGLIRQGVLDEPDVDPNNPIHSWRCAYPEWAGVPA